MIRGEDGPGAASRASGAGGSGDPAGPSGLPGSDAGKEPPSKTLRRGAAAFSLLASVFLVACSSGGSDADQALSLL